MLLGLNNNNNNDNNNNYYYNKNDNTESYICIVMKRADIVEKNGNLNIYCS